MTGLRRRLRLSRVASLVVTCLQRRRHEQPPPADDDVTNVLVFGALALAGLQLVRTLIGLIASWGA